MNGRVTRKLFERAGGGFTPALRFVSPFIPLVPLLPFFPYSTYPSLLSFRFRIRLESWLLFKFERFFLSFAKDSRFNDSAAFWCGSNDARTDEYLVWYDVYIGRERWNRGNGSFEWIQPDTRVTGLANSYPFSDFNPSFFSTPDYSHWLIGYQFLLSQRFFHALYFEKLKEIS